MHNNDCINNRENQLQGGDQSKFMEVKQMEKNDKASREENTRHVINSDFYRNNLQCFFMMLV